MLDGDDGGALKATIPNTVLVVCEPFPAELDAERVAAALARGLQADGRLECDRCPLAPPGAPESAEAGSANRASAAGARLDACDFDARLRAARCLVIATATLSDDTLAGSVAFEAATRARQGGIPAYAVTAQHRLDPFEARIVDLQVVLEARYARALGAAGRKLARLV